MTTFNTSREIAARPRGRLRRIQRCGAAGAVVVAGSIYISGEFGYAKWSITANYTRAGEVKTVTIGA